MAGYNWACGKSNNAVRAERAGKLTATAFAAWVRRWKRFAGCRAADVANALDPCEWHHTSKFFRTTNYYDRRDLLDSDCRRELAAVIRRRKAFEKILRAHGGSLVVRTPDGEPWYTVTRRHVYDSYAFARACATLERQR